MTEERKPVTEKPLQRISWSKKKANNYKYYKDTADYYIKKRSLDQGKAKVNEKYGFYNGHFSSTLFSHVTDPLGAKDPKNRQYGAKIRPTGILRTNIDLLMGEYPRRPFIWQVVNLGEDGYNSFIESLSKQMQGNLTQHFIAAVQQEAQAAGVPVNEIPQDEEIQLPEAFAKKFKSSYKDNQAIRATKWVKRAIKEYGLRNEQKKMFKDYLIAGWAHSYKSVEKSTLVYERIPIAELSYANDDNQYIEDKEWVVRTYRMNISDIVDEFYDEIKNSDLTDWEKGHVSSPPEFYGYLMGQKTTGLNDNEMMDIYHVVWKGKKQMAYLYYPDPLTGEIQKDTVDGDYIPNLSLGETMEKFWVNEWQETTRIGKDKFFRMRPVPVQRNEMNNVSVCKGPYNGIAFSDTEADNVSIMDLGMPFQLLHMIIGFTIEKTINKSKGKIMMLDRAAIPRTDGWDEEKTFYYADALGYMLLDRNQQGVDKSMNQYHVLDMTLYDSIAQLITLQAQIKQQWDDLLGITRQRKGQTYASDSVTNNEAATFQSTVITDAIFEPFDQFVEKEFQGLLDLSKFCNIDGVRKMYNTDDFETELLEIDPNEYTYASLGIMFGSSPKEQERFEAFKANIQSFIQNGMKGSTVLDTIMTDSVAELKQKLLRVEEIDAQMQQQISEQEGAQAEAADERAKELEIFMADLKRQLMEAEWDRKDENTVIKGEYDLAIAGATSSEEGGAVGVIPDPADMDKRVVERMKLLNDDKKHRETMAKDMTMQNKELTYKYTELATKERIEKAKNKTALKNKVAGESKKKK